MEKREKMISTDSGVERKPQLQACLELATGASENLAL